MTDPNAPVVLTDEERILLYHIKKLRPVRKIKTPYYHYYVNEFGEDTGHMDLKEVPGHIYHISCAGLRMLGGCWLSLNQWLDATPGGPARCQRYHKVE